MGVSINGDPQAQARWLVDFMENCDSNLDDWGYPNFRKHPNTSDFQILANQLLLPDALSKYCK